uniref:General transcription factor TFIIB n=1 Tax=Alexandrium monilatum TaxID=311494 RepID=A0A7S4UXH7_9DINO|mmetsp:Transcript_52705/g.163713  ORF Transcript_52705/g.163713 Transcript_52705/m.163713 type:complete len:343 (+) Transcript_52705:110-1138(+)
MTELSVNPRKTTCKDCGEKAKVVLDHSAGDLICTTCGLVLEGQIIDDGQEWRNFGIEGAEYGQRVNERERADRTAAVDIMSDQAATTGISGSSTLAKSLQKTQFLSEQRSSNQTSSAGARNEHKAMKVFTTKIRETAGRLALGEGIVNRCVGLYQDLIEKNEAKSRMQASWYCALVHIASVQEKATRTISELAEANAGAASKKVEHLEKQIEKRVKEINRILGVSQQAAYVEDEALMARFVQRLGLSSDVRKPASTIAQEAYRYGLVGRQPQTAIVASSILIVAWLLNVEAKPRFADVAHIAKVPEAAVRGAYKQIHGAIRRLLPPSFVCRLPGGLDALPQP